jgi:hypothetical protein
MPLVNEIGTYLTYKKKLVAAGLISKTGDKYAASTIFDS